MHERYCLHLIPGTRPSRRAPALRKYKATCTRSVVFTCDVHLVHRDLCDYLSWYFSRIHYFPARRYLLPHRCGPRPLPLSAPIPGETAAGRPRRRPLASSSSSAAGGHLHPPPLPATCISVPADTLPHANYMLPFPLLALANHRVRLQLRRTTAAAAPTGTLRHAHMPMLPAIQSSLRTPASSISTDRWRAPTSGGADQDLSPLWHPTLICRSCIPSASSPSGFSPAWIEERLLTF